MTRKHWALGVVALAAAAGAWYGWTSGLLPGNSRAPTAANFARAVGDARLASGPDLQVCVTPAAPSRDTQSGIPDIAFRNVPGQHRIVLPEEPVSPGAQRDAHYRLLAQYAALAKAGLLDEATTTVTDADGTTRPARQYRLTWKGYLVLGASGNCFVAASRTKVSIEAIRDGGVDRGMRMYEITYRLAPDSMADWAASDAFQANFESIQINSERFVRKVKLYRGDEDWLTEPEAADPRRAAQRLAERKLRAQGLKPPPLDETVIRSVLTDPASPVRPVACLAVPTSRDADEVGDVLNRSAESAYFATFYFLPTLRTRERERYLVGHEKMRRLELAGLAKGEVLEPTVFRGMPVPGGMRFTLQQELKHAALDQRIAGCLRLGEIAIEAISFPAATKTQLTEPNENDGVLFRARGRVVDPPEWARALANKSADAAVMLEAGVPISGYARLQQGAWKITTESQVPIFAPDLTALMSQIEKLAADAAGSGVPPGGDSIKIGGDGPQRPPTGRGVDVVFKPLPLSGRVSIDGRLSNQVAFIGRVTNAGLTASYCCAGAKSTVVADRHYRLGRHYWEVMLRVRKGAITQGTWTDVGVSGVADPAALTSLAVERGFVPLLRGPAGAIKLKEGDVVGIALDLDQGALHFHVNGMWPLGKPGEGRGIPIPQDRYYLPAVAIASPGDDPARVSDAWTANFGKAAFWYPIPREFKSFDGRQGAARS